MKPSNSSPPVTRVVPASPESIREATAVLRSGGLVAFPTETVYGLGADAENPDAVRALFAAKGRPADHPVIVHLAEAALLPQFASEVSADAWKLVGAFWPGPMTLVLRRSNRVSNLVTGGLETVGLRVPAHPVARALLQAFGGPIAAPSANRFGHVSATRAGHVADELSGYVEIILDGGECDVGVESTIIDLTSDTPAILRPGGVTAEQVASVLGRQIGGLSPQAPRVSGSLPSHYAPRAKVEIVSSGELATRAEQLAHDGKRVAVLSSEPIAATSQAIISVSLPADATAQAHSLYELLRRVDELGCDVALISLPNEQGIGVAIVDRLRRAAGPR